LRPEQQLQLQPRRGKTDHRGLQLGRPRQAPPALYESREDDHGRLPDRAAAAVLAAEAGKIVRGRVLAGKRARPLSQQGPVHHQALSARPARPASAPRNTPRRRPPGGVESNMWSYTLRRLLATLPTLLAVITVCYLLVHAAPGG